MSDNNGLYREKSMKRLSSPEQLNDYLRVTNPGTWVILGTVIFLLTSLIIWSSFASIQSFAEEVFPLVPVEGLEPPRPKGQQILSL